MLTVSKTVLVYTTTLYYNRNENFEQNRWRVYLKRAVQSQLFSHDSPRHHIDLPGFIIFFCLFIKFSAIFKDFFIRSIDFVDLLIQIVSCQVFVFQSLIQIFIKLKRFLYSSYIVPYDEYLFSMWLACGICLFFYVFILNMFGRGFCFLKFRFRLFDAVIFNL